MPNKTFKEERVYLSLPLEEMPFFTSGRACWKGLRQVFTLSPRRAKE